MEASPHGSIANAAGSRRRAEAARSGAWTAILADAGGASPDRWVPRAGGAPAAQCRGYPRRRHRSPEVPGLIGGVVGPCWHRGLLAGACRAHQPLCPRSGGAGTGPAALLCDGDARGGLRERRPARREPHGPADEGRRRSGTSLVAAGGDQSWAGGVRPQRPICPGLDPWTLRPRPVAVAAAPGRDRRLGVPSAAAAGQMPHAPASR